MASYTIGDSKRANDAAMAENAFVSQLSSNEMLTGYGSEKYGGNEARDKVRSSIDQYDKYYKHATGGRSRYAGNQINNRMFNQLMFWDRQTYQQVQPFIKGRFIFVPGEMPLFMERLYPEETQYMRTIFQSAITGVNGFQDRQLTTSEVKAMTEQNSYSIVTNATGVTRQLQLQMMPHFQGLAVYRYINTWMHMIFNPGSSAATYPYFTQLEYHEGHHSMTAAYAVVDPSFQLVEDGTLIYGMVPTNNVSSGILNQQWGAHDVEAFTLDFKCHTLPPGMPQVQAILQGILSDYVAQTELHDYYREPDDSIGKPETNFMGMGPKILHEPGRQKYAESAQLFGL